jgi:hypothetical protein
MPTRQCAFVGMTLRLLHHVDEADAAGCDWRRSVKLRRPEAAIVSWHRAVGADLPIDLDVRSRGVVHSPALHI